LSGEILDSPAARNMRQDHLDQPDGKTSGASQAPDGAHLQDTAFGLLDPFIRPAETCADGVVGGVPGQGAAS